MNYELILHHLSKQNYLTLEEKIELANFDIFEFTEETIKEKAKLFSTIYSKVKKLCQEEGFQSEDAILLTFWRLWLPLALQLAQEKESLKRPIIQGILGGQGTGKTTLTKVISLILNHWGYSAIGVSIDDLYKTYAERQQLLKEDPFFIKRGPPGTHDINLGLQLLNQVLQAQTPIFVPRFDKSLDDRKSDLEKVDKVDILLFEGWFVGVQPVALEVIDNASFIASEDKQFARNTNERLKAYLPLWEKLDRFMILYPIDYHFSIKWRKEAEQKMTATSKSRMNHTEIEEFVKYFWKALHPELFITPLTRNAELVDLVVEILEDHSLGKIYRLGN